MQDFLAQTFYGNTIAAWAVALGIGLGAFLVGKTLYWIITRVVRRAASRTRTQLDDFVIDTIKEPIVLIATVLGLWIAVTTLVLPDRLVAVLWNATQGAMVIAVTWMAARLFEAFVSAIVVPWVDKSDTDLDDQLLPILRRGGKSSIWILGVIVALNNAGYDVAALIAGLGIGGLALAMAARDTVANVFGGFTIFTDRPFVINDRIQISGYDGTVSEIGIRTTRLRTLAGREVSIPNSRFADSPVENVSREPSRKITVVLGLTYDTDRAGMRRGMEILEGIVADHQEHLEEDRHIGFTEFGDSALKITFIYYIKPGEDILGVQSSMNLAILDRFEEAGLEMAFPTQTVYTIPATAPA